MLDKHKNADGTYNGVGVMSEVTGLSSAAVTSLWAEVKANADKLRSCPRHSFKEVSQDGAITARRSTRYRCDACGGEISSSDHLWYTRGLQDGAR